MESDGRWHVGEMVETRHGQITQDLVDCVDASFWSLQIHFLHSLTCTMHPNAELCELPQWVDLYTVFSSSVWPLDDSKRQSRGQEEKEVLAFIHQSYFPTESPLGCCLSLQKVPTPMEQPSPYSYSFWIPVTDPNSSIPGLVKSLCCFQF